MPVTRSWSAAAPAMVAVRERGTGPRGQWFWLIAASLFVAGGLASVFAAKSVQMESAGPLVNLNTVPNPDELLPLLEAFPNREERALVAERTFDFLERSRPIQNAGALSSLRVTADEIAADQRWDAMRKRANAQPNAKRFALLPLGKLKPLIAVRTPDQYRREFFKWSALYFAGFYLVALAWKFGRFRGDCSFLPALQMLSGIGFALMVSMRDPLRDTLEFHKFATGVFTGCLLLALTAIPAFDYKRLIDWCYTPLFLALGLFAALEKFGRGPAGNDAKVNLGPFQPVEAIKILLVLFLAGYFTRNWERLRDLREKRVLPQFFRRIGLPRLEHIVPALCAVAIALSMFFKLKDLGPALVMLFVFLSMFAVARGRPGLALSALALMVASVAVGYRLGQPHTVVERIDMWLAPWDNDVHGGDQLAHGLWALATGGPFGSGPGWGDPAMIPAGNTDLVLPAIGEEWGFLGVSTIFLLFSFLVSRSLRAAIRASTHYGFFLGLGLACLITYEMMLISSGVLGALPLSGVVSPFLSSGNTAMLANFAIFALLASISADPREEGPHELLRGPARYLKVVMACAGLFLVATAARYQVQHDSDYIAREAHSFEEDGVKRPQRNPRLNSIAREIPRGTIYDRNGLPVATSSWAELEKHRAEYEALGISLDACCSRFDTRFYPFGRAAEHVVGDLRTGESFHASNASLVEHDSNSRLQGYDFAELAPLARYRHQPGNPDIARLLARDRGVHLTIDIRLQARAQKILEDHLQTVGAHNGSVVVMDATSGDVLAMVSAPAPDPPGSRSAAPTPDELLDRARYGQYPPGSTFKIVTAIAALTLDPGLRHRTYLCRSLPEGRAGTVILGWNRDIKDDVGDHAHGTIDMERAIAVSCNAYFAQLGVHDVGAKALADTAAKFGISTGEPANLRRALPFAAYGQGEVLVSPFKMARVAAAIASGGRMPEGRWLTDPSNTRTDAPIEALPAPQAAFIASAMRRVVTEGTGRNAMAGEAIQIAGKTGTAQLDAGLPHAWFTGFAPYDASADKRLAFAVIVEHGGYGARAAAPVAREVVEAAKQLGLIGAIAPVGPIGPPAPVGLNGAVGPITLNGAVAPRLPVTAPAPGGQHR
jgi:cell division protein FtsI/penicillin-binding protein 2/cell division protein FtsW (lipid II flippase)